MMHTSCASPLDSSGFKTALLAFNQPFGFNAILGLIGLASNLMGNTLILTDQIKQNQIAGLLAPAYAEARSNLAKSMGGQQRRKTVPAAK